MGDPEVLEVRRTSTVASSVFTPESALELHLCITLFSAQAGISVTLSLDSGKYFRMNQMHLEACFVNCCFFTTPGPETATSEMQVKTILNSIEKYKSFVYGEARWCEGRKGEELEILIQARKLRGTEYEEVMKHSRWCLLKQKDNLTGKQTVKLAELMKHNLQTMKAYLMREDFNRFWTYRSAAWAGKFLREWCLRANQSNIEPMKALAKTLTKHERLLLNWFESRLAVPSVCAEQAIAILLDTNSSVRMLLDS